MAEYDKYLGKYTRTSAENYEEFLAELNVNIALRKAATFSTPKLEVKFLHYFVHFLIVCISFSAFLGHL